MRSSCLLPRTSRFGAVLCSALLALGNGPSAPDAETAALLDAIQAHYDAVNDFAARFVQTSHIASLGRDEVAEGHVWVRRPGRMRWEYQTPEPRVIVVDGETLRLYSPDDKQLQIAPLASGAFSPTALDFLLGSGKLREQFVAGRLPDGEDGSIHLRLQPRRESRFQFLELRVAPDTQALRSSVVVDLLGNRTEVRFESLEENQGVPEERFTISVPKGTEVLDLR